MIVSPDVIGMIIALFAFTLTVLGGVATMLSRQSKQLDERFDRVDQRFERIEERMGDLTREVVELKVAVARIEGPRRHLQQF